MEVTTMEEALKYIDKLERTLRRMNKTENQLREDNFELARKCKEHFTAAQNLMRYEFKIPEDYNQAKATRVVHGTVAGTGEQFSLGAPEQKK